MASASDSSGNRKRISSKSYVLGLSVLLACAYSQYVIGSLGPVLGMLVVYGVPILVTGLICGSAIFSKAVSRMSDALKFGLGFFGGFSVLSFLVSVTLLYFMARFDPSAIRLLSKPNPVLNVGPEMAWVMVWASLLIVGPAEEYLFRGFVFGSLLDVFNGRHWFILAFASSIIFAIAHLYYAIVYGVASLLAFTDLLSFGMAMAVTYYLSGGNLLIPTILHGAYDATGFIGVAFSSELGILLRLSMTALGVLAGLLILIQRARMREKR
jgi:membrane protease YdiL (CAAX protease family)